jgi:hypothetical protein
MAYSDRNVCNTVENRPRYETARCTIVHLKTSDYCWRLYAEDGDPQHIYSDYHEWDDHAGGLQGGTCSKCGKTLKDVRVRVNPRTGAPVRRSTLASEIARTPADVPPVHFIGQY